LELHLGAKKTRAVLSQSKKNTFQSEETVAHGSSFWRPVSYRYLSGFLINIGAVVLIVLVTVEALFLSDIIISRVLAKLLPLGIDMTTILKVTLFAIPSGLFIALPTAILIGVYLVLLRRREDQEFIVSAGFGYGLKPLLAMGLFIGLIGAGLSIALSGFVEPLARYQLKTTMAAAVHQAIRSGELEAGRFYSVGDSTLFASSGRFNDVATGVFIHQKLPGGINKTIFAREIRNPKAAEHGTIGLIFGDAHVYEFADLGPPESLKKQQDAVEANCAECDDDKLLPPLRHMFFNTFYSELPSLNLPEMRSRTELSERTLSELLLTPKFDAKVAQEFGERVLRAALCLLAPFLAMVAVSMTTRTTLLFAMPVAAGTILVLSFFGSGIIEPLSTHGNLVMGMSILAGFVFLVMVCVVIVHKMRRNLARSIAIAL